MLKEFDTVLENKINQESVDIDKINSIHFKDADLGYNDITILKDVNIEIKENEKVLIVGSSGAVKVQS